MNEIVEFCTNDPAFSALIVISFIISGISTIVAARSLYKTNKDMKRISNLLSVDMKDIMKQKEELSQQIEKCIGSLSEEQIKRANHLLREDSIDFVKKLELIMHDEKAEEVTSEEHN